MVWDTMWVLLDSLHLHPLKHDFGTPDLLKDVFTHLPTLHRGRKDHHSNTPPKYPNHDPGRTVEAGLGCQF